MSRFTTLYLCAALLGLTAVVYLPLWNNELVDFDDEPYITANPGVIEGLSWSGLSWAWTNEIAPYWMPLTWVSLQFDAQCFSSRDPEGQVILSPVAFHAQNLLWHAGSVLLLFGLWQRLTGARWRSFLLAALFAIHPMHVESVAWAIERKDVLSVFFGVLTLWAYVLYLEKPSWKRYLPLGTALLLSLLAKPMLITLPFVLLLLDYWPLCRISPTLPWKAALRRLIREKAPLFALAATFAFATLVSRFEHGSLVAFNEVPLIPRVANALTAYGWYLFSTFSPSRLAVLYPHPYDNWSLRAALAGGGALLSISALCWWQARQRPWLTTGWYWFVGTLLPVIGLAQGGKQAWADRFSYWPHIGLFIVAVWGLGELVERFRIPARVAGVVGALILGCLGALTWSQVGYWRNTLTLWEHTLAVTENNLQAQYHVAIYYRNRGQMEEAEPYLIEAARIERERLRSHLSNGP
jgi:protein O-mannosyl-transferase